MAVFFKNNRIAGYIRKGLRMNVEESKDCWLDSFDGQYYACALGLAVIGKFGLRKGSKIFYENLNRNDYAELKAFSEILQIQPLLVEEISKLHNMGLPAIEIAECLEYEEGDDQLDLHP
jgi:hypothetical protein